jgi:hypothetical protein
MTTVEMILKVFPPIVEGGKIPKPYGYIIVIEAYLGSDQI